jgi:hypothetical protein
MRAMRAMRAMSAMRTMLVVGALAACRGEAPRSEAPTGSTAPPEVPPALDAAPATSAVAERLRALFGTPGPKASAAEMIAKLEAERARAPERERPLFDRAVALVRSTEAAMAERDGATARKLYVAVIAETIALNDAYAALAPDDLDLILVVSGSLDLAAAQIESIGVADEIAPRAVKQKARAHAARMIEVHPQDARAWALLGNLAAYDDLDARLRAFARAAKLDPANARYREMLDLARTQYTRPFCEGADRKPVTVEWREVARAPFAGSTPFEHHYEKLHLAPAAKYTSADVVRIRGGETTMTGNLADGTVEKRVLPMVTFELAPAARDAMAAWTRSLETRGGSWAMLQNGTVLYVSDRALFDESSPGITGKGIDELCAKTRARTLPRVD